MARLYPPILENQGLAIPYKANYTAPSNVMEIIFDIPDMNVLTDIRHYQITIKYKNTGGYAIDPAYSPDKMTLFLEKTAGDSIYQTYNGNTVTLKIPYFCFNGGPRKNISYSVQVRFGSDDLTAWTTVPAFSGATPAFAAWRAAQINKAPSGFGEWSNAQTVYCYGNFSSQLTYDVNKDFVPELIFSYSTYEDTDPLVECIYTYQYYYGDIETLESKRVSITYNDLNTWSGKLKLNIAPLTNIKVSVEGVTKNNHIIGATCTITPIALGNANGSIVDGLLEEEEKTDGIIYKVFETSKLSPADIINTPWLSVYRVNLFTLETVKILDRVAISNLTDTHMKDFSVEMGEDYQYIGCLCDSDKCVNFFTEAIANFGFGNPGYGRLTRMDSAFLTTKYHQLRLQGNVSLTSFKKNVSDNFQTTIGSKYPFYSRNSEIGYRSFQLQAVVTLNCDPTNSFFHYDENNGLLWKDKAESKLVVLNRDLFGEEQFSRSRVRTRTVNNYNNIVEYDNPEGELRGPASIYDEYYGRSSNAKIGTAITDENIFMERKFREYVMNWLSDGKPKLFRSETEGNMIVMATGVTFTPLDKTGRMVYTVSMTLTEVAEYNLENLLEYELIPTVFETKILISFPREITLKSRVNEDVIRGLEFYYKEVRGLFNFIDGKYQLRPDITKEELQEINAILSNITSYSFLRADPQHPIYSGLILTGEIVEIKNRLNSEEYFGPDLYTLFKNIDGELSCTFITDSYNLIVENDGAGHLYLRTPPGEGMSIKKNNNPIVLRVKDYSGSADLEIPTGYVYSSLEYLLNISPPYWPIPTADEEITTHFAVNLGANVTGGITFREAGRSADFDYFFTCDNLPSGLELNPYTGEITGSFNNSFAGSNFTVAVEDGIGNVDSVIINYGKVYEYPTIDVDNTKWNIGAMEEGKPYDLDVTNCLKGGIGDLTLIRVDGATETIDVVNGLKLEKTADNHWHIKGTVVLPADEDEKKKAKQAGTVQIKITDSKGNFTTAFLSYGVTVDAFLYRKGKALSTHGFEPDITGNQVTNAATYKIPVGTRYSFDVMKAVDTAGNPWPLVIGGLPFSAEHPYVFEAVNNLSPDYKISRDGVISGIAATARGPRTAEIKITDARNESIVGTFEIDEIVGSLKFIGDVASLRLPESFVGQYNGVSSYKLEIPFSSFTGGYGNGHYRVNTDSLDAANIQLDKVGMIATVDTDGVKISQKDPANPYPTTTTEAAFKVMIAFEDVTFDGSTNEKVEVPVQVDRVYEELIYTDVSAKSKTIRLPQFEEGDPVKGLIFDKAAGGRPPYTVEKVGTFDMGTYEYYSGEGTEQVPSYPYVYGKAYIYPAGTAPAFWVFDLSDSLGQKLRVNVEVPVVYPVLRFYPIRNMKNIVLVKDKTIIPNDGSVKIVTGEDGKTPYVYGMKNDYYGYQENEIIPGLFINPSEGSIYGTPTSLGQSTDANNKMFKITDALEKVIKGLQYDATNPSRKEWFTPRVVDYPRPTTPEDTEIKIPTLTAGEIFYSDPLFEGGITKEFCHPKLEWSLTSPTGHAVISDSINNIFELTDFGLKFDRYTGKITTIDPTVGVTLGTFPATFVITATIPAQNWTPLITTKATISFGAGSSKLKYTPNTNYDLEFFYKDTPPLILDLFNLGGANTVKLAGYPNPLNPGDITFAVKEESAFKDYLSITDNELTIDFSTITSSLPEGKIVIRATNNVNGDTADCSITIKGVYFPMSFKPYPSSVLPYWKIPYDGTSMYGGYTVDMNAAGFFDIVDGGSGSYSFALVCDSGPVGADLYPFNIIFSEKKNTFTLDPNIPSTPARLCHVVVTDNVTGATLTSDPQSISLSKIVGFPVANFDPVGPGAMGAAEEIEVGLEKFLDADIVTTSIQISSLADTWSTFDSFKFYDASGTDLGQGPVQVASGMKIKFNRPSDRYTKDTELLILLKDSRFAIEKTIKVPIGETQTGSTYNGSESIAAGMQGAGFAPIVFDFTSAMFTILTTYSKVKAEVLDPAGWNVDDLTLSIVGKTLEFSGIRPVDTALPAGTLVLKATFEDDDSALVDAVNIPIPFGAITNTPGFGTTKVTIPAGARGSAFSGINIPFDNTSYFNLDTYASSVFETAEFVVTPPTGWPADGFTFTQDTTNKKKYTLSGTRPAAATAAGEATVEITIKDADGRVAQWFSGTFNFGAVT